MAAFYANPQYGLVPGAPQGLNYWIGPQFNMSGLPPLPPLPPPPLPPPPPPPLSPTVTPQDVAVRGVLSPDTGGAQPGGGGPGTGPGGIGGASGGGQDTTTSGYQGVYAQAPDEMNSQFGQAGGLIGMGIGGLAGIPGVGTVAGALGGALDAARYNGVNAQYGIPGTVNPWGSALASVLSGIGIPFTDLNLARAFGVPTAQQRQNAILDLYGQPISREDMGFGAMAANAPNNPSAPFGNTGWGPGMNPTTSQYPPGFFENEAARTIAANPDIFGSSAKGAFDAGAYGAAMSGKGGTAAESTGSAADKEAGAGSKGSDPGGSTGSASDKGDVGAGQQGGSGDTSRDGSDGGYKYRGGLIGAPPGRYAAGGAVGRAAARARSQDHNLDLPGDLPGYLTDRDMSRDAGSQGNWQPPISPALEQFMNRIELGAARNLPVTGPLDPVPDRPSYAEGGVVPGRLSPADERQFQYAMRFTSPYRDWYRDFNARFGEPPNLDAPEYNTRAAWQYGVQPAPYAHDDGHYHWESAVQIPPRAQPLELKSEQHPTRWMQTFMERYGTDPNEATPEQLAQALREGIVPMTPRDTPGAYAAGGAVPPQPGDNITPQQFGALRAINPPGPDDQIGALQTGEGVITKAAMARYPGLLAAVNAGTLDPGRVKGLLTPAGMGRKPRLIR